MKRTFSTRNKQVFLHSLQQVNWFGVFCVTDTRGLGMIIKARKYLNKAALMSSYYLFIYPYLTYCNQIWGTAYPAHQTKLIVIQKKAVRIIAGAKYRAPTDALFSDLGILKCIPY